MKKLPRHSHLEDEIVGYRQQPRADQMAQIQILDLIKNGLFAANPAGRAKFEDEFITAQKIKANTITANEIAVNTITSDRILTETLEFVKCNSEFGKLSHFSAGTFLFSGESLSGYVISQVGLNSDVDFSKNYLKLTCGHESNIELKSTTDNIDCSHDIIMKFKARIVTSLTVDNMGVSIRVGEFNGSHFGIYFKIDDGTRKTHFLFGHSGYNFVRDIDFEWEDGMFYIVEVRFYSGSKIELYINGQLEYTEESTLVPSSGWAKEMYLYAFNNDTAAPDVFFVELYHYGVKEDWM